MLISQSHGFCYTAFQDLCAAAKDLEYSHDVQEEFDKYILWASNVGAAHAGKTHQLSLDYRLREASAYKDRVLKYLDILKGQIGKATEILTGSRKPFDDFSSDSDSDTSSHLYRPDHAENANENSSWEITSDSESEFPPRKQRNAERVESERHGASTSRDETHESSNQPSGEQTEMCQLLSSIRLAVTCLYKLPLRKPAPVDRLADRSTKHISCFQEFDALYVRDKFPDLDDEVKARLAKMITRRRQLLLYREKHNYRLFTEMTIPENLPVAPFKEQTEQPKLEKQSGQQLRPAEDVQSQRESHHVTLRRKATTIEMDATAPSNIDNLSALSVADSESKTSIAASEVTRDINIEVPPRPQDESGHHLTLFQCKYCSLEPYIRSERAWRKHVLNDLQPYVCTYPNCALFDHLFEDRDAWFSHEINNHRMEYFCNTDGHRPYVEKSDFHIHLSLNHSMSPEIIATLPDMFSKPLSSPGGICNLCLQPTKNLKSHISRHLEQIALFALPRAEYSADDENLDGTSGASHRNANGYESSHVLCNILHSSKSSPTESWNGINQRKSLEAETYTANEDPAQQDIPELDENSIVDWNTITNHILTAREEGPSSPAILENFGAVADITDMINLSAYVAWLCLECSRAVQNAKNDIQLLFDELDTLKITLKDAQRLFDELDTLKITLKDAQKLLSSQNGWMLRTSQRLHDGLSGCKTQLKKLERQLEDTPIVRRQQRLMKPFSLRALKSPFESKDVNDVISTFKRQRDTLLTALTFDQNEQISQTLVLSKLPIVIDAAFDSYASGNDTGCLPGTRVKHIRDIRKWAEDPEGQYIFWLNGMAGTGKSTISRTVAESFTADKEILSASFFFKQGERDRDSARMLFSTIATQLVAKEPALAASIRVAIDADPALPNKSLEDQFKHLIRYPLQSLEGNPTNPKRTIVLVIDALDECEQGDDVKVIIGLLSQAKALNSVHLRTFVTSRPELPIRLGFSTIKGQYQDLVLHEIPKQIVEHDIAAFLEYKLKEIRDEYNGLSASDRHLPSNWPGIEAIQTLVQIAVPFFTFAAITCRFIKDDPASRLNEVLNYHSMTEHNKPNRLDATYRPILDRLIAGKEEAAKRSLMEEFRTVVGSIVLLAEPLSTASLAGLLNIPLSVIDRRLMSLSSVLSGSTSTKSPVRIFHPSFRDFLVDHDKRDTNPFWLDERAAHEKIANRCLELLSLGDCLRKNICNIDIPGMARMEVDPAVINSHLPAAVRYACIYWVHHLEQSRPAECRACITDNHQAYIFLKYHFLHWLEALSLMGKISESIAMIRCLQDLISSGHNAGVTSFLGDASRFILNFESIIDLSPLQVYSSAIIFAPERSAIRNNFQKDVPDWISVLPKVDLEWSARRQTIEGHDGSVYAIAFSPDGKTVASGSSDNTVRLWDAATGEERQKLNGHSSWVRAVAFSPDGKTVASGSSDKTVRLWDVATGAEMQKLEGHSDPLRAVAFSPDGKTVASGSIDNTVRLWDAATGEERQKLNGHSSWVYAIAFSPDGKTVASGSSDNTVRLWDAATGEERQKLNGHSSWVRAVAFSPDGKTVASGSYDNTVRLWDAAMGKEKKKLEIDYPLDSLSFSLESRHLNTSRGLISLESGPEETSPLLETSGHSIMFGNEWVTHNGKRVLWLPPDYRPDCMASHYNAFALGYNSGLVKFVQFRFS